MEDKHQIFEVFTNAGKAPGVEIWRIEDFNPVPVPKSEYGKFYSGDSYIILNTRKTNSTVGMSWDIHFWLGKDTSMDEAGSAAILSVELDEMLDGKPVQHRELQGHESQQFLSYFKAGIRYLPGGVASGFHHVTTNGSGEDSDPVLYQVKGKRNVRVRQVEAHVKAMNHSDCFILDGGSDIYVWVGKGSKRVERIKAITAANMIRDQDHGGRSKVHIIDEFSDDGDISSFFRRLGSGDPGSIEDGDSSDDDDDDDQEDVALYKVSDEGGKVAISKVASNPLSQSLLNTEDCYVLDARSAGLYTWIGHQASKEEKMEAVKRAQQFLKENHRPSWTRIQRVVEDGEPASFKQFFRDWQDEGVLDGLLSINRLAAAGINNEEAATPLPDSELRHLARREGPAVGFMPDDGRSGDAKVWRVDEAELVEVPPEHFGRFFGGDSYVISYTYCKALRQRHVIYFWQGQDSSQAEKAAAAIHAVRLVDEFGGDAMQVRVTQGHEPRHFLNIFKGKMIVFLGGHQSGFRDIRDYDTFDADASRLFQVRGTCDADVRIHQVPAKTASLNSDDAFVLDSPDKTYLWLGQEASDAEREAAEAACRLLAPGREPQMIREGSEPDDWWSALGGIGEYTYTGHHQSSLRHNHAAMPPRLFHCQITSKGKFRVYEVGDYTQDDLAEDDVLLLDSGDEIYLWVGKHSSEKERELSLKTAEDYLRLSPVPNRQNAPIVVVRQNEEPAGFTTLFPDWDSEYWEGVPSYEHIRSKLLEGETPYVL